jgi:ATP-dependent DNA ligase
MEPPRGADFTYRFPTIAEAVRNLAANEALIDGEATPDDA